MTERLKVAFVDDEPNILTSMRRTMLSMLDEWEMCFCKSGGELLERLSRERFDVVVSDMRMPEMNGARLLQEVAKRYPDTVRVILSGYADQDCIFQTVGPAHIYMAKPCDPAELRRAIANRAILRKLISSDEMRQLLGGLTSLPSAPSLFFRLVAELRSPHASAASVADLIDGDAAMTAELLKLTNSSYFAVNARVTSVLQAVRILGMELVQTLVLKIGIFRQFHGSESMEQQIEALNGLGQTLGPLAERFALTNGQSDEITKAAHCAAQLCGLGCLILLSERNLDFQRILEETRPGYGLHAVEEQHLGVDHGLIGAYLLGLWGFSDLITEAVAFAAWPSRCPNRTNPILTALHLALACGPPFPLLEPAQPAVTLDTRYLAETGTPFTGLPAAGPSEGDRFHG